jgi:hypothetical protein
MLDGLAQGVLALKTYEFDLEVDNRYGLHPARTRDIARICESYDGSVEIGVVEAERGKIEAPNYMSAKSQWSMIGLFTAVKGSRVRFRLYGSDEDKSRKLEESLREDFSDFERRDEEDLKIKSGETLAETPK